MLPWLTESTPELIAGLRETSLSKIVRDDMLALILRGELKPGQRINEPDVAARLGVSRVPVREALRELESSGLVAARKHAGVFVRVLASKEVADLYELRSVLDAHAGGRAAELPDSARRQLVGRLNAQMRAMRAHARQHDVQDYYAANLAFHWAIVEAAHNEALGKSYQAVVQQLHLARLKNLSHDIGMKVSMEEHDHIVAAIAEGNAAHARDLLMSHVTASHGRLVDQLDPAPAEEKSKP